MGAIPHPRLASSVKICFWDSEISQLCYGIQAVFLGTALPVIRVLVHTPLDMLHLTCCACSCRAEGLLCRPLIDSVYGLGRHTAYIPCLLKEQPEVEQPDCRDRLRQQRLQLPCPDHAGQPLFIQMLPAIMVNSACNTDCE